MIDTAIAQLEHQLSDLRAKRAEMNAEIADVELQILALQQQKSDAERLAREMRRSVSGNEFNLQSVYPSDDPQVSHVVTRASAIEDKGRAQENRPPVLSQGDHLSRD
jgi:septal ring factor EnvC (AmiA/AmiB activator)